MKHFTLSITLALALVSCSKKRTYYILTSNGADITEETRLFHRGVEIGKVDHIGFWKNKVLLECSVEKYAVKTTDSLILDHIDILTIVIDILPGRKGSPMLAGDTIVQDLKLKPVIEELELNEIREKVLRKMSDMIQIDSVKRHQLDRLR